jgi:hypothetical protein
MTNLRTLFLGAALALAGVLAGEGIAHADCDYQAGPMGYSQARVEADACETNYGEVVRVSGGFVAYCVPDDVAEGCIDVSSLLDCSLMSAESCDEAMGRMFGACLALQAAGGK